MIAQAGLSNSLSAVAFQGWFSYGLLSTEQRQGKCLLRVGSPGLGNSIPPFAAAAPIIPPPHEALHAEFPFGKHGHRSQLSLELGTSYLWAPGQAPHEPTQQVNC